MGTSFVAGRDFDEHDNLTAPKVAIVNEEFARKIFHGSNPVGRSFRREESADKPDSVFLVVGLVRNTKYYELREDFRPIAFVPEDQDDDPWARRDFRAAHERAARRVLPRRGGGGGRNPSGAGRASSRC